MHISMFVFLYNANTDLFVWTMRVRILDKKESSLLSNGEDPYIHVLRWKKSSLNDISDDDYVELSHFRDSKGNGFSEDIQ